MTDEQIYAIAAQVRLLCKECDSADMAKVLRQALTGKQAAACVYLLAETAAEMHAKKAVITINNDGSCSLDFIAAKGKELKV